MHEKSVPQKQGTSTIWSPRKQYPDNLNFEFKFDKMLDLQKKAINNLLLGSRPSGIASFRIEIRFVLYIEPLAYMHDSNKLCVFWYHCHQKPCSHCTFYNSATFAQCLTAMLHYVYSAELFPLNFRSPVKLMQTKLFKSTVALYSTFITINILF